eukprot:jgi/Hompol1/4133/HPOL_003479-RA
MASYARYFPAPTTKRSFVSYVEQEEDRTSSSSSMESVAEVYGSTQSGIPLELDAQLKTLPLFTGAPENEEFFLDIGKSLHVRKYAPGDAVIRQGEISKAMFLIIKGTLKVISEDGEIEFVGEIGILFDVRRTATVVANTPCTLAILMAEDVHQKLNKYPDVQEAMKRIARDRFSITSKELEKKGRKPVQEVSEKLVQIQSEKPALAPMPAAVARRRSICVNLSETATSDPLALSDSSPKQSLIETPIHRRSTSGADSPDMQLPEDDETEPVLEAVLLAGHDSVVLAGSASGLMTPMDITSSDNSTSDLDTGSIKSARSGSLSNQILLKDQETPMIQSTAAMLSRKLNEKRRVSVAVWSDDKLMQFAQNVVNQGSNRESKMQTSFRIPSQEALAAMAAGTTSEEMISAEEALRFESQAFFGLGSKVFSNVLRYFDFMQLMTLRRINKHIANMILDRSYGYLVSVDLSVWNKRIDDKAIGDIVCFCGENVQVLNLRNCWHLTDQGLSRIAQYATRLRALNLSSVWEITDIGLSAIAENCNHLRFVELSNCRKLTDRAVLALLDRCDHLESIGLGYCKNLSDAIMDRKGWSRIKRVNLQRCTGIFDGGYLKWREKLAEMPGSDGSDASSLASSSSSIFTHEERNSSGKLHAFNIHAIHASRLLLLTRIEFECICNRQTTVLDSINDRPSRATISSIDAAQTMQPSQSSDTDGAKNNRESTSSQDIIPWGSSKTSQVLADALPRFHFSFSLIELNLSDCSFLTNQAIASIAECCSRLEKLCLSFCCSLTEKYADALVQGCRVLDTLDVSYCGSAVTDTSLQTLNGLRMLTRISIRGCVQVTDHGIETLLTNHRLKALNLTQCKFVSAAAIVKASQTVRLVTHLGFFDDEVVGARKLTIRPKRAATTGRERAIHQ